MMTAFAVIALQAIMSIPISTSLNIATPYERAATAITSGSAASIEQTQLPGGQAATQSDAMITVRRGSAIALERVPKGKPSK